jgi:hypothetical protein
MQSGTESTSALLAAESQSASAFLTAERLDTAEATLVACLRSFPYVRFRVTGDCMAPVLPAGSTVTVAPSDRKPPRIGDIVLVCQSGGLRLHRLIWGPPLVSRGSWRTKGDRARLWDGRAPGDAILGTVIAGESGGDPGRWRVWHTARSAASGLVARLRVAAAAWGRP